MVITNSAGGASSLGIGCPKGCLGGTRARGMPAGLHAEEFGDLSGVTLAAARGACRQEELHTDDREPSSETFWVACTGGGVAKVHITGSKFPQVHFEYIFIPEEPPAGKMLEILLARKVHPGDDAPKIEALIARLADEAFAVRKKATEDLAAFGLRAVGKIAEALKTSEDLEVKIRLREALKKIFHGLK